ncbi:MAG: hypothetical protein ACRDTU_17930 [Micromonosporaceae bacterium]
MGVYHSSHRQRRWRFRDTLDPQDRRALYIAAGLTGMVAVGLVLTTAPVIWGAM